MLLNKVRVVNLLEFKTNPDEIVPDWFTRI